MSSQVHRGDKVQLSCKELFADVDAENADSGNITEMILIAGGKLSTPLTQHIAEAIVGLNIGQPRVLTIDPALTFGPYQSSLLHEVESSIIPPSAKAGAVVKCKVKIGDHFEEREATVIKVGQDRTTVDFNHPLAGKTLQIEITILKILRETEMQAQ